VLVQIRTKDAGHIFRDVPTDTAFFLGHTATVDHAAARGSGSCDAANL
jgi:hypothetical protein